MSHQLMQWVGETLFQSGQQRFAKISFDIPTYHMDPYHAGEIALEANISRLILTHLIPPVPRIFLRYFFFKPAKKAYKGKVQLGEDGMHFKL